MRSNVHVSLDTEVLKRFTELSKLSNQSRNEIISELVAEWVEDYEDYLYAEAAMEDLKAGKDVLVSHEDFKKEMAKLNHE